MVVRATHQQFSRCFVRSTLSEGLMMRWPKIVDRCATILVTVLCVTAAARLEAQQPSSVAVVARDSTAQASSTSTRLLGPRLPPVLRSYEPRLPGSSMTGSAAAASGDSHTITVTTLVLVLVVIIAVLLIVK